MKKMIDNLYLGILTKLPFSTGNLEKSWKKIILPWSISWMESRFFINDQMLETNLEVFSGLENSIWEIFTRQWYSKSRHNESSFPKSFPKAVQAENNERQTSGWKRRKKRKKNSKKIRIFQLQRRLHRICIRGSWSKWCMILQN